VKERPASFINLATTIWVTVGRHKRGAGGVRASRTGHGFSHTFALITHAGLEPPPGSAASGDHAQRAVWCTRWRGVIHSLRSICKVIITENQSRSSNTSQIEGAEVEQSGWSGGLHTDSRAMSPPDVAHPFCKKRETRLPRCCHPVRDAWVIEAVFVHVSENSSCNAIFCT
jgi:hypothetical protein